MSGDHSVQVSRSLVDRITYDRPGPAAPSHPNPRPLAERITFDTEGNQGGVAAHNLPTLRPLAERITFDTGGVGNSHTVSSAVFEPSNGSDQRIPEFDPLFDEPVEPPVTTEATLARRVEKNPANLIQNAKLRALFGGKKVHVPQRSDQPILRMGMSSKNARGHDLVCASPDHGDPDDL